MYITYITSIGYIWQEYIYTYIYVYYMYIYNQDIDVQYVPYNPFQQQNRFIQISMS